LQLNKSFIIAEWQGQLVGFNMQLPHSLKSSHALKISDSVASEEELAAITAAVEAYMAIDVSEDDQDQETAAANAAMSPWAVANRFQGVSKGNVSSNIREQFGQPSAGKNLSLWSAKLLAPLLLFSLFMSKPALAQLQIDEQPSFAALEKVAYSSKSRLARQSDSAAAPARPQTSANNIRVCLASAVQKIDLDFPDGGNIYTVADGVLVAKVAPQSCWSLNLAVSGARANYNFVAKSGRDKIAAAGSFARAAFVPSTSTMIGISQQLSLPAKTGDNDTGTGDSTRAGVSSPDCSQGYIAVAGNSDFGQSKYMQSSLTSSGSAPLLGVNGKLYRGAVILRPVVSDKTTSMAVINVLDLEDYLLSVVPSEVPSLWPKEVLKAQAIAARSYAVANLGKHTKEGYDVKATVDDQVYRGVIAESIETNSAVAETSGLVLKNNNKVISAFFHSTSGGSTEVSENVWSKPLPYLKSVVDYDDAAPQFNWKKTITSQALAKTLAGAAPAGENQTLLGVLVIGRYPGVSQRVRDVLLVGQNSARVVSGADLRRMFNLPSTQFSLFQADSNYIFSGRGYGHGLGLSQWGAKALADNGYNAEQILSYYYKDVTIEPLAQDGVI